MRAVEMALVRNEKPVGCDSDDIESEARERLLSDSMEPPQTGSFRQRRATAKEGELQTE